MVEKIAKWIDDEDIVDMSQRQMKRYAVKIILDRAIPDARDGLKPVQRRMLYTLHTEKLTPTAKFVKVSTVAGLNMAYYHPHGQADGVLIDLSQAWIKRLPLVETHGNNGSIDGSLAAAGRYVSARQSKYATLFLEDIDKHAVKMVNAYHDGKMEPVVLPAALPAALVNGSSGVSFGMRTDILPHNALELLKAAKALVLNPKMTSLDILKIVKGPDFPTGALLIADQKSLLANIETGSTSFKVRGIVEIDANAKRPTLTITSVPWKTNTSTLIGQISKVIESTKLVQVDELINGVESHTDLKIEIIFKKKTPLDKIKQFEALLYKKTDLEVGFRSHNLMIVDGKPKVLGVFDTLKLFISFRLETLKNIWTYEKEQYLDRLELVEGLYRLVKGFPILDVMKNVTERGRKALIDVLSTKHEFTVRQAEYIADMSVYRLKDTQAKEKEITDEYNKLKKLIAEREKWLTSDKDAEQQLLKDFDKSAKVLSDLKRLTKIVSHVEDVKIERVIVDDVESKPCVVIVRKDLQALQMGVKAFENQKEKADFSNIVSTLFCKTDDYLVFFTKKGRIITRRVNDLEQGSLTSTHQSFNRIINTVMTDDEIIKAAVVTDDAIAISFSEKGYIKVMKVNKLMLNVSNKGYLKRSGQFSSVKNGDDEIKFVEILENEQAFKAISGYRMIVTHQSHKDETLTLDIPLSKIVHRNDGAGGNGAKYFDTKDGLRKILRMEVIKDEINKIETK